MEIYRNHPATFRMRATLSEDKYAESATVSSAGGSSTVTPTFTPASQEWQDPMLEIPIEFKHTVLDGPITITINVNDGSEDGYDLSDYATVVTPLFRKEDLPPEFSPTDTVELERLVRHVIEAYTGQYFGKRKDRRTINSSQSVINFNVPLIEFTGVSGRYMTHTTTLTPPKIPYEILNEGHTLAVDLENYDVKTDSLWILNTRRQGCYIIEGTFGYDRVPQDVKQAALLIAGMWGCNQAVWRDRFISTMRSADWSVAYHDAGFGHTTGSHGADMLLSKYSQRYNPAVI